MSKAAPVVMVVEDEMLLLQAISKKLKLSGVDVLSCTGGEQALSYLKDLTELPDAIWLDFYLKDMNGLTFMTELNKNPEWKQIPVIVVSNSASPDKVQKLLELGVKKHLLKAEHRLDEIIEVVKVYINKGEQVK